MSAAAPLDFLWPRGFSLGQLEGALAALGTVRRLPPVRARRVFLDTFDWRLVRKGFALEAVREGGESHLVWRPLGGPPLHRAPGSAPRFGWELAEGAFRRRLEEVATLRALLPVAEVATRAEGFELLGPDDKVVCRVLLERHKLGKGGPPLAATVRVEPVRGYGEVLARVQEALAGPLGLAASAGDVVEAALAAAGVTPSDHSTKVRVEFEPEQPAADAARLVFRRLLETLNDNEAGVRGDVDSEFLHDFRVAVRRTRAALTQFRTVLPPKVCERFRREFAWLGQVTTPTRDLDVHLLDYPRYRDALPADVRPDLEPLLLFLRERQQREHRALVRALDSGRYRRLKASWRRYTHAAAPPARRGPGEGPVRGLADARLRKVFRRTLREGRALGEDSPPAAFHELRKRCKKLRYLLEFFQSLYPADEVRPFVDALKGLQDNLGEFQDLTVQTEALRLWAREMEGEHRGTAATWLAMGMLVEKLLHRQQQVRTEFSEAFGAFAHPANGERFEALFRRTPREEAVSA